MLLWGVWGEVVALTSLPRLNGVGSIAPGNTAIFATRTAGHVISPSAVLHNRVFTTTSALVLADDLTHSRPLHFLGLSYHKIKLCFVQHRMLDILACYWVAWDCFGSLYLPKSFPQLSQWKAGLSSLTIQPARTYFSFDFSIASSDLNLISPYKNLRTLLLEHAGQSAVSLSIL